MTNQEKGTILINVGGEIKCQAKILQKAYGYRSLRELISSLIKEKWDRYPKQAKGEISG